MNDNLANSQDPKKSLKSSSKSFKKKFDPSGSIKFIDLFAGIGGIRLGLQSVFHNAECVFSSEWDKHAQVVYENNHGDKPYGDITKISEKDIPNHDILLAGFPCQPFSNAGLKKGFDDLRGTLFFDIARIVKQHKPEVLFLENVKGLKGHNKGRTFSKIYQTLNDLGYTVYSQVLNARDFGVPQNRERIYIVCFRRKIQFSFPVPTGTQTKLGNILSETVPDKYTISDKLWAGHQYRKEQHKLKGNGFGYSMFTHDSPYTSTISARYYKDGSEILVYQEGKNPRRLTPREAARLQGFPEEFKISESDTQAYKQFGNSVAVPVIKAISKSIEKALLEYKPAIIDKLF